MMSMKPAFRTTRFAAAPFIGIAALALAALAAPPVWSQAPPGPAAKPAPAVAHPLVTLVTTKGTILIKLFPEEAPKTCENFEKLINKKFYDGLTFHRVEPGFVIQGGDPKGDGTGGPGYAIKDEMNKSLRHNRGAVAMANSGPDSAGSQFYIVIAKPAPHLDNGKYTIFGQVIAGQDVAEKITVGDKMTKVTVKNP